MANPTPEQRKFINNELKQMAKQDKKLAKAGQREDLNILNQIKGDARQYGRLAAKYTPTQAQDMAGLSQSAIDRIQANNAQTNAIGSAQANALAGDINSRAKAASDFMRQMYAAAPQRHREYVQYLHNIKPGLMEEKQAADFRQKLAEQEFGLARDQFEESQRQFNASLEAGVGSGGGGLSNEEAAALRVQRQKTADSVYDKLYRMEDIYTEGNLIEGPQKTGKQRLVGPKNPFKAGFKALREKGFTPDQAAKMAYSWANRYGEEIGAPSWQYLGIASDEELARLLKSWGVSSKMYNRIKNQI